MRKTLPEPCWIENIAHCPYCSYSREGLQSRLPCPECGKHLPERMYIMYGIPRGMSGASTPFRYLTLAARVGVGLLCVFWIAVVFLAGVTTFVALAAFLAIVFLILRRRSGKSGPSRLVFVPGGVYLESTKDKLREAAGSETFIAWTGTELFRIGRVGTFWKKIQVRSTENSRLVFEAGVRCPDAQQSEALEAIRASVEGAVVCEENSAYPSTPMPSTGATTTRNDSLA